MEKVNIFTPVIPHLCTKITFTRTDKENTYTYERVNKSGLLTSDEHLFSGASLQIKCRLPHGIFLFHFKSEVREME